MWGAKSRARLASTASHASPIPIGSPAAQSTSGSATLTASSDRRGNPLNRASRISCWRISLLRAIREPSTHRTSTSSCNVATTTIVVIRCRCWSTWATNAGAPLSSCSPVVAATAAADRCRACCSRPSVARSTLVVSTGTWPVTSGASSGGTATAVAAVVISGSSCRTCSWLPIPKGKSLGPRLHQYGRVRSGTRYIPLTASGSGVDLPGREASTVWPSPRPSAEEVRSLSIT